MEDKSFNYGKMLIWSGVVIVLLWGGVIVLAKFDFLKFDLDASIIAAVSALATLVVIGNYAQVKDIETRLNDKVEKTKNDIETKFTQKIENIVQDYNSKIEDVYNKIPALKENLPYELRYLEALIDTYYNHENNKENYQKYYYWLKCSLYRLFNNVPVTISSSKKSTHEEPVNPKKINEIDTYRFAVLVHRLENKTPYNNKGEGIHCILIPDYDEKKDTMFIADKLNDTKDINILIVPELSLEYLEYIKKDCRYPDINCIFYETYIPKNTEIPKEEHDKITFISKKEVDEMYIKTIKVYNKVSWMLKYN